MATHDYVIANQGFPAFRSDLNNALAAIVSNNSSATEPTTMFAHMIWVDTAADPSILKIRNADNDAWITIGSLNQTADTFTLTSAVSATTLNTSGAVVFNDAGADVDFRVEGDTDANLLFVDASTDRVGIGTNTPDALLNVDGIASFGAGSASTPSIAAAGDLNTGMFFPAADTIAFAEGGVEAMRVSSSGQLLVGQTSDATAKFAVTANVGGDPAYIFRNASTNSVTYDMLLGKTGGAPNDTISRFLTCFDTSADRMFILSNGNLTNQNGSYGTISDQKLKQDIVDAGLQWDDIKAIRFRKYRIKTDVEANPDAPYLLGVVAQELEEVSPGLVDSCPDVKQVTKTREIPAVLDANGNQIEPAKTEEYTETVDFGTTTKSVKTSILYMKAVKALQEAMERIETLEAKVAALEAK